VIETLLRKTDDEPVLTIVPKKLTEPPGEIVCDGSRVKDTESAFARAGTTASNARLAIVTKSFLEFICCLFLSGYVLLTGL
jgi:hypothetical protein